MCAVRVTAPHMELVSYIRVRSRKPLALPGDELFAQAPDGSASSNAVSPDPPPPACCPHRPAHTSCHSLLKLFYHNSRLFQPAKMPLLFSQTDGLKRKSGSPGGTAEPPAWKQETPLVLPSKSSNLSEPRELCLLNGRASTLVCNTHVIFGNPFQLKDL